MNAKCASSILFHVQSQIAMAMNTTLPSARMQHQSLWGKSILYKHAASTSIKTSRTKHHYISEDHVLSALLVT